MSEKQACMRVVDDEVWYDPSSLEDGEGHFADHYGFQYKLKEFLVGHVHEDRVKLEAAFGQAVPGDRGYTESLRHKINMLPAHIAGKRFAFTDGEPEVERYVDFESLPDAIKQEVQESHDLDGVEVISEGQFLTSAAASFKKEDPDFKCCYNSAEMAKKVYSKIQPKFYYEIESNNEVNNYWANKIANQNVIIVD